MVTSGVLLHHLVSVDILGNYVIRELYLIHCHYMLPILYILVFGIQYVQKSHSRSHALCIIA